MLLKRKVCWYIFAHFVQYTFLFILLVHCLLLKQRTKYLFFVHFNLKKKKKACWYIFAHVVLYSILFLY